MTKDEEVLSAIIQERGYLVTRCHGVRKIGELLPRLAKDVRNPTLSVETEQLFYVIAETDEADYIEQAKIIERHPGYKSLQYSGGSRFYRVTTD